MQRAGMVVGGAHAEGAGDEAIRWGRELCF